MSTRTLNTSSLGKAERTVQERSTFKWTCTLHDEDGNPIPVADLTTVTLTISDAATGTKLVSSRDVKNANGGTIDASGYMELVFGPADSRIVNDRLAEEMHRATVLYQWDAGLNQHWHVLELHVTNHPDIA